MKTEHTRPTLRPSQIADLMRWLTGIAFNGEMVRCWRTRDQAQCERWADFEIHRCVTRMLAITPVGKPRKLPQRALQFMETRRKRMTIVQKVA